MTYNIPEKHFKDVDNRLKIFRLLARREQSEITTEKMIEKIIALGEVEVAKLLQE